MAPPNVEQPSTGFFHGLWTFISGLVLAFMGIFLSEPKPSLELPAPVTTATSTVSNSKEAKTKARNSATTSAAAQLDPRTAPSNPLSDAERGQVSNIPPHNNIPTHPSLEIKAGRTRNLQLPPIMIPNSGFIFPARLSAASTCSTPFDTPPATPHCGFTPTFLDVVEFAGAGGVTSRYLSGLAPLPRVRSLTPIVISKAESFDRLPSPWSPVEESATKEDAAGAAYFNAIWTSSPKASTGIVKVMSIGDTSGPFAVLGDAHFSPKPYFDDEGTDAESSMATSESGEGIHLYINDNNIEGNTISTIKDNQKISCDVKADHNMNEAAHGPTEDNPIDVGVEWFSPSAFMNTPKILLTPPEAPRSSKYLNEAFQLSHLPPSDITMDSPPPTPSPCPSKKAKTQDLPSKALESGDPKRSIRDAKCISLPCITVSPSPSTTSLPTSNSTSSIPRGSDEVTEKRNSKALDDIIFLLDEYKTLFVEGRVDAMTLNDNVFEGTTAHLD